MAQKKRKKKVGFWRIQFLLQIVFPLGTGSIRTTRFGKPCLPPCQSPPRCGYVLEASWSVLLNRKTNDRDDRAQNLTSFPIQPLIDP